MMKVMINTFNEKLHLKGRAVHLNFDGCQALMMVPFVRHANVMVTLVRDVTLVIVVMNLMQYKYVYVMLLGQCCCVMSYASDSQA